MNTGRSQRGSIPRSVSQIMAMLAPIVIGLVIHGMQVNQLGLYWDDSEQLMQGLQAADGNVIRFILSDTFGYLHAERPVAHVLMMIHRAAFAISLSTLHWSVVVLLILNAIALETIVATIVGETWLVFAVGVLFLTYPLSPLQAIWPATAPYLWACLLALLTILCSWYGLRALEGRRLKWFVLSAFTYIASLLTHEVFALLPLAFMSLYVLSKNGQNTPAWYHLGRISLYKPAMWGLSLWASIFGVYGLWRVLILPLYGTYVYPSAHIGLDPIRLAKKVLMDITMVFISWVPVFERISGAPPPLTYVFWSAGLFVVTWVITLRLVRRSPVHNYPSYRRVGQIPGRDHSARAAMIGLALTLAAVIAIGVSPVSVNVVGANSTTFGSRGNFVATIGIALALPALFALLVQRCLRYMRLVQQYPRYTRLFGLASLACLIYMAFIGFPPYGAILSHKSAVPILFARYSLAYGLMVIAYIAVIVLIIGMVILSSVSYLHNTLWPHIVHQVEPVVPQIRAHFLASTVACMVLLGSLFHFSIKEEFANEWRLHKAMLEQLRSIAPAITDDTFVIIVHTQPSRLRGSPYMSHTELSSYMLALYDNWSVMGNTDRHIRFYRDGVETLYFSEVGPWFPPGVRGPRVLYATVPVPHISYDRILLFAFDGMTLHMLPQIEVEIEGNEHRVVKNNPDRILHRMTPRTAVWRHVTGD